MTAKSPPARGPAGELWNRALSQVPTAFGRLAFLASLRDPTTGRYSYAPLVRLLGPEEADRTLCHSHHQVFSQWIGFSLAEQKKDLADYLASPGKRPVDPRDFRALVPLAAHEVERQLYVTDLETLLELLRT